MEQKRSSGIIGWLISIGFIGIVMFVALSNRQGIMDWYKLRGYSAPADIAAIADQSAMSSYARSLFYINHPQILAGEDFRAKCPIGGEKTIVLGCYHGNDSGIFLYQVSEARLNGVVQTTAAHEMLHAGYERLRPAERDKINRALESYYATKLSDQRIKDTIEAYRQDDASVVDNEMHSIFATEVADLPEELETYYDRYFTDRRIVVGLAAHYQEEFTSRRTQAAAYDAELKEMKQQIEASQSRISSMKNQLDAQDEEMQILKESDVDRFNRMVGAYNGLVERYNALLSQTHEVIDEYNAIVEKRNALALEEQGLVDALSGKEAGTH